MYFNKVKEPFLIAFTAAIIVLFLNNYLCFTLFNYPLTNDDILSLIQIGVTIIGGVWALRIYNISKRKEKNDFLKTYAVAEVENQFIKIKTEVQNETNTDREITASFIIIIKQGEDILDKTNTMLNQNFKSTTKFIHLKDSKNIINESFAFIQLPYYTSENIKVGNEDLSFSLGGFEKVNSVNPTQKIYEVRFFVYRKSNSINPYHRCVQTCFVSMSGLDDLFYDYKSINQKSSINTKKNK